MIKIMPRSQISLSRARARSRSHSPIQIQQFLLSVTCFIRKDVRKRSWLKKECISKQTKKTKFIHILLFTRVSRAFPTKLAAAIVSGRCLSEAMTLGQRLHRPQGSRTQAAQTSGLLAGGAFVLASPWTCA